MQQLVYSLRFCGDITKIGVDGNILRTEARASGCALCSEVGASGLSTSIQAAPGDAAILQSELVITSESSFVQAGTISFGADRHRLRFTTIGPGYLSALSPGSHRQGVAIWKVTGGEGQFAGASGLIASAFDIDDTGTITDHQLGLLSIY